jgi:hypothetical protein
VSTGGKGQAVLTRDGELEPRVERKAIRITFGPMSLGKTKEYSFASLSFKL